MPIPPHIDIFLVNEEYPKTDLTAVEAVIDEAKAELAVRLFGFDGSSLLI
jgi:ATP-binding cassette subfamily F protein 2